MNRKNLKSLQLNKKSISNLNVNGIKAGAQQADGSKICQTLLCRDTKKKLCGF